MNDDEKPVETNKNIITIVVLTLAVNATIGVSSLAYCLILGRELNTALLTAFVGIVNYVLGAVSGMLAKTSSTPTTPSMKVQVTNPPTQPVPVEPQPPQA